MTTFSILLYTLITTFAPSLNACTGVMLNSNTDIKVTEKNLTGPITMIGKNFTGSYENTSQYLDAVKKDLKDQKIKYHELEAVSVYLSDLSTEKPSNLNSFHGFVIKQDASPKKDYYLRKLEAGKYIVTATKKPELLWNMFQEAYQYAGKKNITIADVAPVLITTVENKAPLFSIYFLTIAKK